MAQWLVRANTSGQARKLNRAKIVKSRHMVDQLRDTKKEDKRKRPAYGEGYGTGEGVSARGDNS
jgi:hypothetical protein